MKCAFNSEFVVYDATKPQLDFNLVVNNSGNIPLKILGANGGCSCRKIDKSGFPAVVLAGEELKIPVTFTSPKEFRQQSIVFSFETDHGNLTAPASLTALPSVHLSPSSIYIGTLAEGQHISPVEVVFRRIEPSGSPSQPMTLGATENIEMELAAEHSASCEFSPDYRVTDRTYRVRLKNEAVGDFKEILGIKDAQSQTVLECPVSWKRIPYIHSTPERVVLGSRPIRVFLRCPDESAELSKVISAPKGIIAVITSTRELTVRLDDPAPEKVQGVVEVAVVSDRPDQASLKLPIVRYFPAISENE